MVIDFSKIPAANIDGFKGGKGLFVCRAFGDDTCKIMKNILHAGASTGLHTHETNCEVIYVLSGVATCHYDDVVETVVRSTIAPKATPITWQTTAPKTSCSSPSCPS